MRKYTQRAPRAGLLPGGGLTFAGTCALRS